jgi:hypothetical protein
MTFETNVFINCPFDAGYKKLLRPLLFTVIYVGMQPRIALEAADTGQARIDKIIGLIRESKFSIHDISRIESTQAGELYRLNMPFELGLDLGCRHFGGDAMSGKKTLVMEAQQHRYKAALSDLSGFDIEAHGDEPYRVITVVRNWLTNTCNVAAPGPAKIANEFTSFMADDYDSLIANGFSREDIEGLQIGELITHMRAWTSVA